MSISKNTKQHQVRIVFSDDYKYFVTSTIFDSSLRKMDSENSDGEVELYLLSQGIYTVRLEMNGEIKDTMTFIDADKEFHVSDRDYDGFNTKYISPPSQFSSASLGETYNSSHEYYTNPSIDLSRKETLNMQRGSNVSNSSLFIFLRFPSIEIYNQLKDSYDKPFYVGFELVDKFGDLILNFEAKDGLIIDEIFGSAALNVTLDPGVYFLIYKGREARQIPIYVFKNWNTQFFMTLGSEPLFGTIRLFVSKERSFAYQEKAHKYVDILLDKIQNQDFTIDGGLLQEVANGTFDSPILELICCYIYFQKKDNKSDVALIIILQNLKNSIFRESPDSADLLALNILASKYLPDYSFEKAPANATPMFRIGFETILNASVDDKNLIPQNSINDFISENLYFDSPYNTFKLVPFPKRITFKNTIQVTDIFKSHVGPATIKSFEQAMVSSVNLGSAGQIDIFSFEINKIYPGGLFKFIDRKSKSQDDGSWIENAIAEIVKTEQDISISDIANNLNVSPNTVLRIFSNWEEDYKTIS